MDQYNIYTRHQIKK